MKNKLFAAVVLAAALALPAATAGADETAEPAQAERVEVGDEAPAIALPDTEGTIRRSADLVDQKHLIAVFFRGAW